MRIRRRRCRSCRRFDHFLLVLGRSQSASGALQAAILAYPRVLAVPTAANSTPVRVSTSHGYLAAKAMNSSRLPRPVADIISRIIPAWPTSSHGAVLCLARARHHRFHHTGSRPRLPRDASCSFRKRYREVTSQLVCGEVRMRSGHGQLHARPTADSPLVSSSSSVAVRSPRSPGHTSGGLFNGLPNAARPAREIRPFRSTVRSLVIAAQS